VTKKSAIYSTDPIAICFIGNNASLPSGLEVPIPFARL